MISRTNAYLCMTASILLSSMAQLGMKAAMVILSSHHETTSSLPGIFLDNPVILGWLLIGLTCYAISLVFWLFAIARLDLSLAYPMLSISYVLVYLVAVNWSLLHEQFTWIRTLGILIVVSGVVLIARTERHEPDSSTR